MYTADASINAKVKGASGWRELLKLLGFRFQKASNGIPDSVFFPSVTIGVADKLAAASNHLHALLGKDKNRIIGTTIMEWKRKLTSPKYHKSLSFNSFFFKQFHG